ncbi:MAG: FtsX-like permease family protein [Desulfuromonadales bacterium]|nr:FtsX-like permease family protein [Desulfuromonadales bacterium]
MMSLLRLAWSNLWRNRRRTWITLAALAFSIMLVQTSHNLSTGVYSQMIESGVRAGSGHLTVYRGNYLETRDEKLGFNPQEFSEKLKSIEAVETVLPRIYLAGLAQSSRESRGIVLSGIDPLLEQSINPILKRLPASSGLPDMASRQALVGDRLLKELQLKEGSKFVVTLQNRQGEMVSELLRVHGVVHSGIRHLDRSLVMIGLHRAATLAGMPDEVHELALILKNGLGNETPAAEIAALLPGDRGLRLYFWDEAMTNLANAIKLDYASQQFMFLIILMIVTIGVVNTLLMAVMERTREFGTILALGARASVLHRMLFLEALILGALGLLLGTFFGSLATWYLVEKGIDLQNWIEGELEFGGVVFEPVMRAVWEPLWMLKIGIYVLSLCILASLYPAYRAGRIVPAESMRK